MCLNDASRSAVVPERAWDEIDYNPVGYVSGVSPAVH